ncbi:MAG: hypothetical protein HZA46_06525 [Planctomycetales bacterium]|nr:hypothetical protein [Planctomycetales bacterium]
MTFAVRRRFSSATLLGLVAALLVSVSLPNIALAQKKPGTTAKTQEAPDSGPLVIVSVASVERLLKQADITFDTAGRAELSETVNGLLERVGDLKGLDRNQPLGLLIYMQGITPQVVAFAPVTNLDNLLKTIEIGPVTTKKISEDRIEIAGPRQTLKGKIQKGYAFLSNTDEALDHEFGDPAKFTAKLSATYDIAASISLKTLPAFTRDLFLGFMRTQTEINLQRRDGEPEGGFRIRKADGMRNLEFIELLLTQGEELTLGWNVSQSERNAALEIIATATPDSELASNFNELRAVRSYFANLVKDTSKYPLVASLSWKIDKSGQKFMKELFAGIEIDLGKQLAKAANPKDADVTTTTDKALHDLLDVLRDTAQAGHFDLAAQFVGEPGKPFVLLGGLKVTDGDKLSSAVTDIVTRLKGNADLAEVQVNVAEHKGVRLHRIQGKQSGPQEEKLYGTKPSIYVGAGGNVFWFAVGGDNALVELRKSIDIVDKPVADTVTTVPFQFVMNFSRWMELFGGGASGSEGFASRAKSAFNKGGDTLRIDVKPLENGMRMRVQLDEAFIRLLGQEIGRRVDDRGRGR